MIYAGVEEQQQRTKRAGIRNEAVVLLGSIEQRATKSWRHRRKTVMHMAKEIHHTPQHTQDKDASHKAKRRWYRWC